MAVISKKPTHKIKNIFYLFFNIIKLLKFSLCFSTVPMYQSHNNYRSIFSRFFAMCVFILALAYYAELFLSLLTIQKMCGVRRKKEFLCLKRVRELYSCTQFQRSAHTHTQTKLERGGNEYMDVRSSLALSLVQS